MLRPCAFSAMSEDDFSATQQDLERVADPIDEKKNKGKRPCFIRTQLAGESAGVMSEHNRTYDCMCCMPSQEGPAGASGVRNCYGQSHCEAGHRNVHG